MALVGGQATADEGFQTLICFLWGYTSKWSWKGLGLGAFAEKKEIVFGYFSVVKISKCCF